MKLTKELRAKLLDTLPKAEIRILKSSQTGCRAWESGIIPPVDNLLDRRSFFDGIKKHGERVKKPIEPAVYIELAAVEILLKIVAEYELKNKP